MVPPSPPPNILRSVPNWVFSCCKAESMEEVADNVISEKREDKYFTASNEPGRTQTSQNTVKLAPVFSRQKRPGLSERKIDSRALQSKTSVNVTKNADSLRSKRVKNEDTTNQTNTTVSEPIVLFFCSGYQIMNKYGDKI